MRQVKGPRAHKMESSRTERLPDTATIPCKRKVQASVCLGIIQIVGLKYKHTSKLANFIASFTQFSQTEKKYSVVLFYKTVVTKISTLLQLIFCAV